MKLYNAVTSDQKKKYIICRADHINSFNLFKIWMIDMGQTYIYICNA